MLDVVGVSRIFLTIILPVGSGTWFKAMTSLVPARPQCRLPTSVTHIVFSGWEI